MRMSVREYQFYAQKVFDCEELKNDTSNLAYQVNECERGKADLHQENNELRMASAEKDTVNAAIVKENVTLRGIVKTDEVKVDRRGNLILVLGTALAILAGAWFFK